MRFIKDIYIVVVLSFFVSTISAQENKFRFGAGAGIGLSQVEGDNLRGFKKAVYEVDLLGGYMFSESDEFIVDLSYGKQGSSRNSESIPSISGKYLTELDLDRISLSALYSRSISQDWDGHYRYRLFGGIQYNRILSATSSLIASSVNDEYELRDSDFKSNYLSLRFGIGVYIASHFVLDLKYEHGLQSVLNQSEEVRLTKLLPFGIGLSLSYYLQ